MHGPAFAQALRLWASRNMCGTCGVVVYNPDTHRDWHKTLPVTEAGLAHERRVRADEMRRGMRGEG